MVAASSYQEFISRKNAHICVSTLPPRYFWNWVMSTSRSVVPIVLKSSTSWSIAGRSSNFHDNSAFNCLTRRTTTKKMSGLLSCVAETRRRGITQSSSGEASRAELLQHSSCYISRLRPFLSLVYDPHISEIRRQKQEKKG